MNISHLITAYGYLALFALVGGESLGIPLPAGPPVRAQSTAG